LDLGSAEVASVKLERQTLAAEYDLPTMLQTLEGSA